MLIIGLNGSPNKKGNTKLLLEKVLATTSGLGAETKILEIPEIIKSAKDPFCRACSSPCSGQCFRDTDLEAAYELLKKADGIIIGSPVYFGSVSGQLKAFFDKTRKLRGEKGLYNTVAAGVTVGGSKYGGQETTLKALHDIMLVHGMIIIGDGYYADDCGHHGICAEKPAAEDSFALRRAEVLAKRIVEVCTATRALRSFRNN
ncbi:MAG TPA: flavodoxin family protein [Peptococcaceae bacterium]|nr:flavodoxin family protein [Peptococcaceae bacterium]